MKAYGVPRILNERYPDVADIKAAGLKSSKGTIPNRNGECRGYFKNKQTKRNARRIWKKKIRAQHKREFKRDIEEMSYESA